MLHLFRYRIPKKYSDEFKDTYSYINTRQVTILGTFLLIIALGVRTTSIFYHDELESMPNLGLYNALNWVQTLGASLFILLSSLALKSSRWKTTGRETLVIIFCIFLLTTSFTVSYLFSLFNPKNTLTIFLTGIVAVSVFFALELKQIITISIYIVILFIAAMVIPNISNLQKLLNVIMSGVLAFFLYACSRYSYYFKAEQFVKVKQLEEKNMEVQLLNHQKGEILGFVAHDLRNPLNNIEALTQIALEEESNKNSMEMQLILTSTRQAKNIINDLIEVAQNEKAPFQLQTTNMIAFMNSICDNWQKNLNKERVINFKPDEPAVTAAVNPSKLTRVIDNLIGNGLKFSKPETPINIELSKSDDTCIIRITDFGIGIPDNLQKILFDQFSKAGRPGLKGEKSIGLGLHISRQIIERHGGSITVNSKENEGTTFQITIPLIAA
ncbi:MAG: HAMP domain-containing sensor histidine kinase [Candidatus Pedobacter colombiensis]|uniref:histidine kinase n=1 Tax=Candidatus Pedobacter colombiensis TaxID=3121371 RepID=A0AAJ6B726_9SPHI|nr:HAMP domain-containing sensor histidine kinase [Pedobacter sp.]WEK20657.1 MAG: HAMP domain-containing sensor histidine kinase [Pedobacter sp.]